MLEEFLWIIAACVGCVLGTFLCLFIGRLTELSVKSCRGYCNQGRRPCDCTGSSYSVPEKNFSDHIIGLHELARSVTDYEESLEIRKLANELAKIGNRLEEKFRNS
jgi:hypothetical protein